MSAEDRQKWNDRYTVPNFEVGPPSAVIQRLLASLGYTPATTSSADAAPRGRALDLAAGPGRHSLLLAQCGLDVTALDISAPGLEIAVARAQSAGLPLKSVCLDLDESPLPSGPWDVVLCTMFLDRSLFGRVCQELAPDGYFVYVQPTQANLARHAKPPADFLLQDGEMPSLVSAAGLRTRHYEEGWLEDGRHDACLIATR